jgi:hypothetical protein
MARRVAIENDSQFGKGWRSALQLRMSRNSAGDDTARLVSDMAWRGARATKRKFCE